MFKKILALALAAVLCVTACVAFTACGEEEQSTMLTPVAKDQIKVGFIFLHDENSTYDLNFINAAKEAQAALGLTDAQVIMKTNILEGVECYEAAADLVEQGCNVIFADSFGHEDYMMQAAEEFPNVQFCHATGTKAHNSTLSNYHNAFASIYEGRYLAGYAAGLKLNEMILAGKFTAAEAKMGYVGAHPYAEVVSGYTSFYLGAKAACPTVTMDVKYTGSWYNEALEYETAMNLINNGCKLISQHADSMGAPRACEEKSIPNVSYNGSTIAACPNTFIVSSRINWAPYFKMMINSVISGVRIQEEYCGGFAEGAVEMSEINTALLTPASLALYNAKMEEIKKGNVKVFDINTFTIDNGQRVDETKLADVNTDAAYTPDTAVVSNGCFNESVYRSAPYFELRIDGITELK